MVSLLAHWPPVKLLQQQKSTKAEGVGSSRGYADTLRTVVPMSLSSLQ